MQICWELVLALRLFQQVICMQSCQQEDWMGMEPEHAVTQRLGPEGFLGPWRRGCRCLALQNVLHVLYSGEMSALPVYWTDTFLVTSCYASLYHHFQFGTCSPCTSCFMFIAGTQRHHTLFLYQDPLIFIFFLSNSAVLISWILFVILYDYSVQSDDFSYLFHWMIAIEC